MVPHEWHVRNLGSLGCDRSRKGGGGGGEGQHVRVSPLTSYMTVGSPPMASSAPASLVLLSSLLMRERVSGLTLATQKRPTS